MPFRKTRGGGQPLDMALRALLLVDLVALFRVAYEFPLTSAI